MQKVSEFQLYELAIVIHPLTELPNEAKYRDVWLAWFNARSSLNRLFDQRLLEFSVTIAKRLSNALTEIVPADFEEAISKYPAEDQPDIAIGFFQMNTIREAAQEFETVLRTELDNADTYFVMPRGTHKTAVLLSEAHKELPANITNAFPEIVEDFNQAGKCMLFKASTATGFHLLRATESMIRNYLVTLTGMAIPSKSRNWGAYIKILEKHASPSSITGILQHIKDSYRNPILHPEVTLEDEDALVLFGLCVSAIIVLAKQIKELKAKRVEHPFLAIARTILGP